MRYEMLGDDGQGYQLWECVPEDGSGPRLGRVNYDPDDRESFTVDTDCDGWDPDGRGYLPMTDIQLSGLWDAYRARLDDYSHISTAAAILGRKGGMAKTQKKAAASRENGKKGGRPRKDGTK